MVARIPPEHEPAVNELVVLLHQARAIRHQARVDETTRGRLQDLTIRLANFLASLLEPFSAHNVKELVAVFLRAFLGRLHSLGKISEVELLQLAILPMEIAQDVLVDEGRRGGS